MGLQHLNDIEAVVTDVDGVLTDGSIIVSEQGETKCFNVRDGMGFRLLQRVGIKVAILTGRSSFAVKNRARELDIDVLKMGRMDKQTALAEISEELGIAQDRIAYIGDDLPDLAPIRLAAMGFCPQDAVAEVLAAADCVVPVVGGAGVVRHVAELILKAQGRWFELVGYFEADHD